MAMSSTSPALSELRDRIARLEGGSARRREVLPFGVSEIDRVLPGGGLALGALHEVAGGANGAVDGAAAALWAAGVAARTRGRVLWCVTRRFPLARPLADRSGRGIEEYRNLLV
jgi:protein ImuA